jgi:microcystin degradation protein MlrC
MMSKATVMVTLAALVAAPVALAGAPWQQVRTIGQRHFVVVDAAQARNTELLDRAAVELCPSKQACVVTFWSDPASVPMQMPMTRGQQQAVVAQYLRNPVTGKADLLLRCRDGNTRDPRCLH